MAGRYTNPTGQMSAFDRKQIAELHAAKQAWLKENDPISRAVRNRWKQELSNGMPLVASVLEGAWFQGKRSRGPSKPTNFVQRNRVAFSASQMIRRPGSANLARGEMNADDRFADANPLSVGRPALFHIPKSSYSPPKQRPRPRSAEPGPRSRSSMSTADEIEQEISKRRATKISALRISQPSSNAPVTQKPQPVIAPQPAKPSTPALDLSQSISTKKAVTPRPATPQKSSTPRPSTPQNAVTSRPQTPNSNSLDASLRKSVSLALNGSRPQTPAAAVVAAAPAVALPQPPQQSVNDSADILPSLLSKLDVQQPPSHATKQPVISLSNISSAKNTPRVGAKPSSRASTPRSELSKSSLDLLGSLLDSSAFPNSLDASLNNALPAAPAKKASIEIPKQRPSSAPAQPSSSSSSPAVAPVSSSSARPDIVLATNNDRVGKQAVESGYAVRPKSAEPSQRKPAPAPVVSASKPLANVPKSSPLHSYILRMVEASVKKGSEQPAAHKQVAIPYAKNGEVRHLRGFAAPVIDGRKNAYAGFHVNEDLSQSMVAQKKEATRVERDRMYARSTQGLQDQHNKQMGYGYVASSLSAAPVLETKSRQYQIPVVVHRSRFSIDAPSVQAS